GSSGIFRLEFLVGRPRCAERWSRNRVINYENVQNAGNDREDPAQVTRFVAVLFRHFQRLLVRLTHEFANQWSGFVRIVFEEVVLPDSGPCRDTDPKLANELRAIVEIGDRTPA